MTDYVKNNHSGLLYEKVAATEDGVWLWLRDPAGTMHSSYASGYAPYTPTPVVGEVWTDAETGGEVVVVGEKDGQPVVIEVVTGDADVVHVAYRRPLDKLRSPDLLGRRRAEPVADDPGDQEPTTPRRPPTVRGARTPGA